MKIMHGDCLELMKQIPNGSVDMVLTDLPYGVANKDSEAGKWDCQIPFDLLWKELLRVTKKRAAIVLFAQGMFTAKLMLSNPRMWRYNLVWDKKRASGFLNAKRMPLRYHEDICVFYRQLPTYNPQMEELNGREPNHFQGLGKHRDTNRCYGKVDRWKTARVAGVEGKKFPGSIMRFKRPHCTGNHPTEKSVELCEYLIRTYTDNGQTVLDATMGSGTTGVACVRTSRDFIGIEKDDKYFSTAKTRIDAELEKPVQMNLEISGGR